MKLSPRAIQKSAILSHVYPARVKTVYTVKEYANT